jgi:hypothetical protein
MIGSAKDGTVGLIVQLGDLLAKTAEAVSKFGDSIAHLVTLGAKGYDAVAARKAHADLIELRVKLVELVSHNGPMIRSIKEYVQRVPTIKPSAPIILELWLVAVDKVEDATKRVEVLLNDVSKIRNDFVLQDTYSTLRLILVGRNTILIQLRALPAPVEPDELQALAKAGEEYQKLSDATLKASDQLAAYVSSLK